MAGTKCVQRLLCLFLLSLPLVWAAGFQGIPGNYCRNRYPTPCCTDRLDDCAVSIQGTLCYCDQFCLNKDDTTGLHDDCCPDFREVCLGQKPPSSDYDPPQRDQPPNQHTVRGCERDGVVVPHLATHKFNCYQCKCHASELSCDEEACLVDEETITRVNQNNGQSTWHAKNYTKFWGWRAKDGLILRTGTLKPSFSMYPIHLSPVASLIPREFDAREKQDWQGLISGIRDQGWCGASWAFSTLAVVQDRLSIMTRGLFVHQLSPQQMVGCVKQPQNSCRAGGHIDRAWQYLRRIGVVVEECLPYESGSSGKIPECKVPRGNTARISCQQPSLYKSEPAYRISNKVEDIQWEIITNGPVQAMMRVSSDLFVYATGVYTCPLSDAERNYSLHAVRVIGWGEEVMQPGTRPTKYWVVANSWGQDWGEGGYFRIRRGSDECGIESFILAVRPKLAGN